MPPPNTTADLIALVRKSNLVNPVELDAFLDSHTPASVPAELANTLVEAGLITTFHREQLLRGKHRGYFLGKYKLLQRIGLGGMGQVFLAQHTSMNRLAALKVLPPEMATNAYTRERFLREARASGQLDHPNLVRALDVDGEGDVLYLVLEYIDGVSLHDLVTLHHPLDPHRAAHYLWQVANGLAYINHCGLVHRDIKPANIVVDRAGVVKLLDLGLVRSQIEDDELTRGQGVKILGTADFLAPEQAIDCSAVDIRADIYSLGATGYFLLTGQTPYTAEKMAQKLIAHQVQPIPRVTDTRSDVPQALSDLLVRMMAKRAEDRPATPEEVMEALQPWAEVIPPLPTEDEIPPVAAFAMSTATPSALQRASYVSLHSHHGSSVKLQSIAGGGSSVRINDPGSGHRLGSHGSSGKLLKTPPPAGHPSNTPLPKQLADRPLDAPASPQGWIKPRTDVTPRPAAVAATPTHPRENDHSPPVLPATATHELTPSESRFPTSRNYKAGISTPLPTEARSSSINRQLIALTVAFCLIAAIAVYGIITF
ncbi:MAG: protein kinase [Bacteroidales bacterium]|nr:protein kinase [Bacteroidales bacterium]